MQSQGISYAYAGPVLLKDLDGRKGIVQFYGGAFNNVDSDGDVTLPGAFTKTFSENGPAGANRIKHLRQHETRTIIGKITELGQDSKGAVVTSQLSNDTNGRDALALYELDLFEHSYGYRIQKAHKDAAGIQYLTELAIKEFSAVTWGANKDTPLIGMKCDTPTGRAETLDRMQERESKLIKALRHGTITDTLGHQLADELEALQDAYKGLISLSGEPLKPVESRSLLLEFAEAFKAAGPDVPKAKQWLQQAIALHEKHMNGTAPTNEASQKTMMTQMKNAYAALGGSMGTMKATSEAGEPSGEDWAKAFLHGFTS